MTALAWVCVGITLGALAYPGGAILARLIAHQPLLYPQES